MTRDLRQLTLSWAVLLAGLLAPPISSQVPLGPTFRVNTETSGQQSAARVALAPDGSFVVVWQSVGRPGDPAVKAQRFDTLAQPLGGEIKVNQSEPLFAATSLLGTQLAPRTTLAFSAPPDVAVDAAGNFLVVWAGTPQSPDIRARLFRRNGQPAGDERVVNATLAGAQDMPAVTAISGGWVVAWSSSGHFDIRARLLDATGTPVGDDLVVDVEVNGLQYSPDIAATPWGFVVAWSSEGSGDPDTGAAFRRFDLAGNALGPAQLAHSPQVGIQADPAVGAGGASQASTTQFLVTWTAGDELSGAPLPDVLGQRFASDGQPVGDLIHLATDPAPWQFRSRAGMDSTGGFAVAWEGDDLSGPHDGLFARPYASTAAPLAGPHSITGAGGALLSQPALAMDPGGDYVVAGTGVDGASSAGIFARRFTTPCVVRPGTLCLQGGRFKVEAAWRTSQGSNGLGHGVTLSADTGYFTFFNPANVEMVVKVLNGCPVNGRLWVFAGGLTNVEVDLLVTDTQTGAVKRYGNPRGTPFQPIQDTGAFTSCSAPLEAAGSPPAGHPELLVSEISAGSFPRGASHRGSCVPGPTHLCLRDGRFAIEVDWRKPNGEEGAGKAVPLTSDTGYLWFFNPANVEMVLKVLNGCGVNGHYWVFAGGLTNVRAQITVTDTHHGESKSYVNPQSTAFQPIQDTGAFATCP